jgi:hypothetical protein
LWLVRYLAFVGLRKPVTPWATWFDQSQYLRSATAFAHLDFSAASHWYPLAYPLLASPFVWILSRDPFLIVDCGLFVATLLGFQRAMRAVGIGPLAAGLVFLATALAQGKVAQFWIDPWTTSLAAPLLWWALALAAELIAVAEAAADTRRLLALGLLLGLMPTARPVDLLFGALIGSWVLVTLVARRRLSGAGFAALAGGAALPVLLYLALHLVIYGVRPADYMVSAAKTGFVFGDLGWKAYVLLIAPQPWFPDAMSLIEKMPWLPIGFAGLLALLPSLRGPRAGGWALILGTALAYTLLMLCYTDLQPPGLWRFNNAHYFKWIYPLIGIGIVPLVQSLRTPGRRWAGFAAIAGTALLCCIRIVPEPVGPGIPARMLVFAGDGRADWNDAYFAPSMLTDQGGAMGNVRDFHQVPDGDRLRALAVKRLIVGDATLAQPNGAPQPALARYGERMSIGLPCWLRRSACVIR